MQKMQTQAETKNTETKARMMSITQLKETKSQIHVINRSTGISIKMGIMNNTDYRAQQEAPKTENGATTAHK